MFRPHGWLLLVALLLSGASVPAQTPVAERAEVPAKGPMPAAPSEALPAGARARLRCGQGSQQISALAFSPDSKLLATAAQDNILRIWDVADAKELRRLEGHTRTPWRLAFSPDGKTLASSGEDQGVRLWDVASGKLLAELRGHQQTVWFVAFAPDGKTLVSCGDDGTIRLWDVAGRHETRQLLGHQHGVWPVAYSPDGRTLASGGGTQDGTVRFWDVATGRELRQCPGHHGGVWPLAYAPDGKTVVSLGWSDHTVRIWEVASAKERISFKPGGEARFLTLAPDGRTVAVGAEDHAVTLWDVATGTERHRFTGHSSRVWMVAYAPDGRLLASGSQDSVVYLWDVAGVDKNVSQKVADWSEKDAAELWEQLGGDAAAAHKAVWQLSANPRAAVAFLAGRIEPAVAVVGQSRIEKLIADLDDDKFTVRECASAELEKLGLLAEPLLRKAIQTTPSLEVRRRLDRLMERLEAWVTPPETLRALRALEVLERAATPRAKQVLTKLAHGAPEAVVTQEAKGSLERLTKKPN